LANPEALESRNTNPAASERNAIRKVMIAMKVTPPGRRGFPYQLLIDAPRV
jgi:hypothetical protein